MFSCSSNVWRWTRTFFQAPGEKASQSRNVRTVSCARSVELARQKAMSAVMRAREPTEDRSEKVVPFSSTSGIRECHKRVVFYGRTDALVPLLCSCPLVLYVLL